MGRPKSPDNRLVPVANAAGEALPAQAKPRTLWEVQVDLADRLSAGEIGDLIEMVGPIKKRVNSPKNVKNCYKWARFIAKP